MPNNIAYIADHRICQETINLALKKKSYLEFPLSKNNDLYQSGKIIKVLQTYQIFKVQKDM